MTNDRKFGKSFLTMIILLLLLFACCLIAGIFAAIPARTEQIYGPADPSLSLTKHYQQCLTLILSQDMLSQPGADPQTNLVFRIDQGDSLDGILNGLVSLGFVQHPRELRAYMIYKGFDTRIQPGDYTINYGLSELEIAQLITNPPVSGSTVSVLAGWRVEEIAESLSESGLELDPDEFIYLVKEGGKEGYLFPGSYPVNRDINTQELIDLLYNEFLTQISPEIEAQILAQGLSLHEGIILASIIEREAVIDDEMPQIASVFLNRLRLGMNLAADPTVQYALGYNSAQETWWTNPLSLNDLKLPSSYNTYENPGLPPGPICNPGKLALQAVAQPAVTGYLYFRAACDGSGYHVFAESFEEHLQNECK